MSAATRALRHEAANARPSRPTCTRRRLPVRLAKKFPACATDPAAANASPPTTTMPAAKATPSAIATWGCGQSRRGSRRASHVTRSIPAAINSATSSTNRPTPSNRSVPLGALDSGDAPPPSFTPTPNSKLPARLCPSRGLTVCQSTWYTPDAFVCRTTCSSVRPDGRLVKRVPSGSVTVAPERLSIRGSLKCSTTTPGATCNDVPGVDPNPRARRAPTRSPTTRRAAARGAPPRSQPASPRRVAEVADRADRGREEGQDR